MAYTLLFSLKKKLLQMQKLLTFFCKNTCELIDIVLTRTVNILTNDLVKLTMLRTTGSRLLADWDFCYFVYWFA